MIANTPIPPYYAVIFSSIRTEVSNGYSEMADLTWKTLIFRDFCGPIKKKWPDRIPYNFQNRLNTSPR